MPIYGWFSEGFETRDLAEARALLARLQWARQEQRWMPSRNKTPLGIISVQRHKRSCSWVAPKRPEAVPRTAVGPGAAIGRKGGPTL